MKITGIIEKGADGLYSVRTEQRIGNFCPGGFGENVDEAKEDFFDSISEAIEMLPESESMTIDEIEVEFQYDLQSFFNYFDFFNLTKLAHFIGINESQLRQYKNGLSFPNEKTTNKILEGVHSIGKELYASSL